MSERITGIYLAENDVAQTVRVEDDLQTYYDIIDCSCIDIVRRQIGNKMYAIVCDDEGLLTGKQFTIVYCEDDKWYQEIVGNVFICKSDDEGNLVSLDGSDVENIMNNTRTYINDCMIQQVIEINWKGVM